MRGTPISRSMLRPWPSTWWVTTAIASLAVALTGSMPLAARAAAGAYVEGEVLVRFRPGTSSRTAVAEDTRVMAVEPLDRSGIDLVRLSGTTTAEALSWLAARADVDYAEPNYRIESEAAPDDSLFSQQWGLENRGQTGGIAGADVSAVAAWDLETGSRDVIVGIVDSGIDLTHPDLAPQLWINPGEIPGNGVDDDANGYIDDVHGWDFADNDNDVTDTYGHGTAVAGVIGAAGNDRRGVAGLCWRVSLMPLRTINSLGVGDVASAVRAVAYATRMGARLTNNSWGRIPDVRSLRDVIEQARDAGVLFVAAAGNGGLDDDVEPHFPSGYPYDNVIAVAATDEHDQLARFSNYGATTVDLAAPGSAILSTFTQGRYIALSGTSLSTPFVSGALALAFARARHVSYATLRDVLMATVDRKPWLLGTMSSGGRLNAHRLLEALDVTPPDPVADLEVESVPGARATLRWIAPADGASGTGVAGYDVRFAAGALDPAALDAAPSAPFTGVAGAPGQTERVVVEGLAYATSYTFAVRAVDAFGNRSAVARFVTATTPGAPIAVVTSEALDWTLTPRATGERSLTIENRGGSELRFELEAAPRQATVTAHGRGLASEDVADAGVSPSPSRPSPLMAGGGLRIMLLANGSSLPELRASLEGAGLRVDERRADQAPLTLDELLGYDAVVVTPASKFGDRTGLGDRLADFADRGGGVVLTHGVIAPGATLQGRFAPTYTPITLGAVGAAGTGGATLIAASVHPLLHGVRFVSSRPLHATALSAGATHVASWNRGTPAVATYGANVVAIDVAYETGAWGGDAIRLLANAVSWSAHRVSWLAAEPASGVVPIGGTARVTLRADASDLNGETRLAELVLRTDDPAATVTALPVRLAVTAEPRAWVDGEAMARGTLGSLPAAAPARTFDVASRRGARGIAEYRASSKSPFTGSLVLDGHTAVGLPFTSVDCLDQQQASAVDPAVLSDVLSDRRIDLWAVTPSSAQTCLNRTYRATLYYVTASDTLDFRDLVIGMRDTLRIWVQNTGRTALALTAIRTGDPELIPSLTQASCGPGAAVSIAVRFVPATVGVHDARLEFATNDPQRALVSIPIRARVLPRPTLRVDTPAISVSLFTGGANTTSLRFGNPGDDVLSYRVEPPATAELTAEGVDAAAVAASWLRVVEPEGEVPVGGSVAVPLVLDAAGMSKGTYTAVVTLVTNDPLALRTPITVRMQVLGRGRLALGGPPIEMESIETFTPPVGETRHAFRISPPPAGGADLQCLLEGDSPAGLSSARLDVDGRYQVDVPGASLPCAPLSGGTRLDATAVAELLADGAIDVRVVRAAPASDCPSWRHVVRWRYLPRLDSLALGAVPIGGRGRHTVVVLNGGDAPLRARVACAHPSVSVRPDTLDVPVNGRALVELTFAPAALGEIGTAVTFDTNDPDRRHVALEVRGSGVPAPHMEIAPSSIAVEVGPGGEAHAPVRVRNTGTGTLRFAARAEWDGWGGAVAPPAVGPAAPPGPVADPASPDDDADAVSLPSSPWGLACMAADPNTGYLYAVENDGARFARFRPGTREWENLSAAPVAPNAFAACVLLRGRLYVASSSGFTTTMTLGVFDLSTETWSTLKLQTVGATGALACDGRRFLYLADDDGLVRVDPETREETAMGTTPIPHPIGAALRYAGGVLYGHDAGPDATALHRYDIGSGTWSRVPDPPGPLGLGGAVDPVHGELVIPAWGGEVQYRLDLATGAWRVTRLPYFATAGVMAWLPGDEAGLYVAQGSAGQRLAREPHAARLAPMSAAAWDVPAGGEADVDLRLAPADLAPGARAFDLALDGNDPAGARVAVPVSVTVTARPRLELGGVWRSGSLVQAAVAAPGTEHVLSTVATPVGPVTLRWFQADRYANAAAPTVLSLDGRIVDSLATAGFGCRDASLTRVLDDAWVAEAMRDGVLRASMFNASPVSCGPVRRWVQCAYPAAGLPLDLPGAVAGDTIVTRMRIANTGNARLAVNRVASDVAELRVVAAPAAVPPGGEDVVVLEWTPRAAGPLAATLTIESDDPTRPGVTGLVRGVALVPPTAVVEPAELRVHVFPGAIESRSLRLANRGGRALSWSATLASPPPQESVMGTRRGVGSTESPSWITLAPTAGTVAPGETARVVVTLDARVVADGWYAAGLAIASNDRERPNVEVPIEVFVGPPLVAGLRIEPRALQPRSAGRWVAARLTPPAGVPDAAVRAGTVRLNDTIVPDSLPAAGSALRYAFDRDAVLASLPGGERAVLRAQGELEDGRRFEGRDTVDVLARAGTLPEAEAAEAGVTEVALEGASPNPFGDATRLAFALPRAGRVRIEVFDLAGRRVRRLVDGAREAGRSVVAWDGRDPSGKPVPAGVYVVRLEASGRELRRRVVRSR